MMEPNDAILTLLPTRLKNARRSKGLSLDAVAKLSGVSRSMVSQIERGESSPTIATLWNLTRALQVDFAGLLDEVDDRGIDVIRSGDVPLIDQKGKGCAIRILSAPEDAGKHELYDLTFDAGGALNSQPHAQGAREQLTVVEGQLQVTSGGFSEQLGPGDTARYRADLPHRIAAVGKARAFLMVVGS